jgi:hypothetical protein
MTEYDEFMAVELAHVEDFHHVHLELAPEAGRRPIKATPSLAHAL